MRPTTMITLHSLGASAIDTETGRLTPSSGVPFALALYLIIERDRRIHKELLRRMFCPSKNGHRGKSYFRQVLTKLRDHGFPIPLQTEEIRLPASFAKADFEDLESTITELYGGMTFLPNYKPTFSKQFKLWLADKRIQVHQSLSAHLLKLANVQCSIGEWEKARLLASRCLEIQADNEEARIIMSRSKMMLQKKKGIRRLKQLPLIGRKDVIKLVTPFVTGIKTADGSGGGGGFFLQGEPGIGKSRIATEAEKLARATGIHTESVKCQPGDEHTPLSIFMTLVPELQKLPGAAGCKEETVKSLLRITSHDPEAKQIQDSGEAEIIRAQIRMAVMDLVDAVVDEIPLLLVVEDVHWLDRASAKLLQDLAIWSRGGGKQMGVLLTSRRDYTTSMGLPVSTAIPVHTLAGLSDEATQKLALDIVNAHGRTMEDSYVERVASLSHGNPFFLHELIKHWVTTGEQQIKASPSLQMIMQERLNQLAPESLRTLQVVALFGKHVTQERVEFVMGYKKPEMVEPFNELGKAGILRSSGKDTITGLHDLYADEAIAQLALPAKKILHGLVGGVLERYLDGQPNSTSILWDCAEHFKEAGDVKKAKWTTIACAQHLTELGYHADAVEVYEKALKYCTDKRERLMILHELAKTQYAAGFHVGCKQSVIIAQKLLIELEPNTNIHNEFELLGFHATWKSSAAWQELVSRIQQCIKDDSADKIHKVYAASLAMRIATDLGSKAVIKSIYESIHDDLESIQNQEIVLEVKMIYETMCGSLQYAVQLAKQLRGTITQDHPIHRQIMIRSNCSIPHLRAGEFDDGRTYLEEALTLAEKYSLHKLMIFTGSKLIYNYLSLERYAEAKLVYTRIEKVKSHIYDEPTTYQFLLMLGEQAILEEADFTNITPATAEFPTELTEKEVLGNTKLEQIALHIHRKILEVQPSLLDDINGLLDEFLSRYEQLKDMGGQDYTAYVLIRTLQIIGREKQADKLLCEYVDRHRLELWPVHGRLAQELRVARIRLKKGQEQDGQIHQKLEYGESSANL